MRRGYLSDDRRRGTIVLEVSGWVGLGIGKLRHFDLVGVVEERR